LGRSEAPGRPILFGTGFDFLERFGLTSVDQLPPLEPEIAERLFSTAADEIGAPEQEPGGLGLMGEPT
jgi:segregation and condensation protein B